MLGCLDSTLPLSVRAPAWDANPEPLANDGLPSGLSPIRSRNPQKGTKSCRQHQPANFKKRLSQARSQRARAYPEDAGRKRRAGLQSIAGAQLDTQAHSQTKLPVVPSDQNLQLVSLHMSRLLPFSHSGLFTVIMGADRPVAMTNEECPGVRGVARVEAAPCEDRGPIQGEDTIEEDGPGDDVSNDLSNLVVPFPELAPVVFFCLKQTTCPRSWCIRMVSSPYPLLSSM
ncbi:hypothetical protein Z043_111132 [Scleropages formosus]|uniref:Voltage-dependent T-type calcium channel subunit alpha-1I-like n=1 Tax=Scleropages formosus TaxID=113540 RepID=A0A0P7V5M3_SCLFO|nr:hypothetical protein Z043_111132 [Scleropages formosus]